MGKGKAGCMCIGKGKELYISLHRVQASAFSLSCFCNSFGWCVENIRDNFAFHHF